MKLNHAGQVVITPSAAKHLHALGLLAQPVRVAHGPVIVDVLKLVLAVTLPHLRGLTA